MEKLPIVGRIEFDISEFNKMCRKEGINPFPIERYQIDAQDENHFNASLRPLIDQLAKWWETQSKKK